MLTCIIFMANISIRYQIAQKVRSGRLKRGYTQKDLAKVESPIPGKVQISILSTQLSTTGIALEELLKIVKKQVTRDDIRVLTDTITVIGCNITEIDIHSRMSISPVISKEEIKKQFIKKFEANRRLGWNVTRSWIIANLFVEGVENVELIEPREDVMVLGNECANLGNLKIELN